MEQMNVKEEKKIFIDLNDADIPNSVRVFRPLLFKEENKFYCVLGPNLQEGVVGSGITIMEALLDWDKNVKKCIQSPDLEDPVVEYIIDTLNTSKDDVW